MCQCVKSTQQVVDIELSIITCFITRFWLVEVVEVFAAVPPGECPLESWSASRLFRRGIRLQAAAVTWAHDRVLKVGQGTSGMGAHAVLKKSTFWETEEAGGGFQNNRANGNRR